MKKRQKYKPAKKHSRILSYQSSLESLNVLPSIKQVFQRIKSLQLENNGKKKEFIISLVAGEIESCWKRQDIPTRHKKHIVTQLLRILKRKGIIYNTIHVVFYCYLF